MPEVVSSYFSGVVKSAARKMHRRWDRFDVDDLEQEAWSIALRNWQLWSDQKAMAHKDLNIHLWHWVETQLPALGYQRVRAEDGKRRWVQTVREQSFRPEVMSNIAAPDPEDDGDCELRLTADWAPMGRKTRERYARILLQRYPVLVQEFTALEELPKPSNRSHEEHAHRKEQSRARLRVKYAQELAAARYAVEGFGSLEAVAA
jgi:hypothetical protein